MQNLREKPMKSHDSSDLNFNDLEMAVKVKGKL